tara:strand:+ start:382 stop:528 length:147 start_codon:yes stop_codon:yes gene_type:complete
MQKIKRKLASYRLKPQTIKKIKKLAEDENTSQGRVIDNVFNKKKKETK